MVPLITILMVLLTIALCVMMLKQYVSGSHDLLSLRNFFLMGFIVFQLTSAIVLLRTQVYGSLTIQDLPATATKYAVMVLLFLGIFLVAYSRGWIARGLARLTPAGEAAPGVTSTLTLAIAVLFIGLVFRFGLGQIPLIGTLTNTMSIGILSLAAGMAAWAYAPRLWNPIVGAVACGVILLALAAVIHNAFGRRSLLSVLTCVMWGAYHSHWKHMPPVRSLFRFGVLTAGAVAMMAAFTVIRSGVERERSAVEQMQLMQQSAGKLREGVVDMVSGQDTARNSMWLIENYPYRFDYITLHSLYYFVVHPIPRQYWPEKPDALGRMTVRHSRAGRYKQANFSIGPGMIGHIAADNPLLALIPYAIGLGLILRYFDEVVRLHPYNPFMVLPMGTALGQIIGLPRGELGLFLFNALWGIIAAYILMIVVARTMAVLGWRIQYDEALPSEYESADDWEHGYEAYDDYGDKYTTDPYGGGADHGDSESSSSR
ncbi:MAG: hypothetical protein EA376_05870 [Phycisphaeraceae bacterium]|nr:MAG: hypothetical protein EA376_05870 [Phycisphaeraceae bacterium]